MNRGLFIFIIILIVVSLLLCFYWGFYKTRQNHKLKEQQQQLFVTGTTAQADNTIINNQVPWNGNSNNHNACPTCAQPTYNSQQDPQSQSQSYYNMPPTSRNPMQQESCQHTTIPVVNDSSSPFPPPPPPPYHGNRSVAPTVPLHTVDNNNLKQNNSTEFHPPHSVRDD